MAHWQRELNLKPEYHTMDNDLPGLARVIADRLEKLLPFSPANDSDLDLQRADIVEGFRDLAEDPDINTTNFDEMMRQLYDWADSPLDTSLLGKKACWISTF